MFKLCHHSSVLGRCQKLNICQVSCFFSPVDILLLTACSLWVVFVVYTIELLVAIVFFRYYFPRTLEVFQFTAAYLSFNSLWLCLADDSCCFLPLAKMLPYFPALQKPATAGVRGFRFQIYNDAVALFLSKKKCHKFLLDK